jgi:O-antigen ligase
MKQVTTSKRSVLSSASLAWASMFLLLGCVFIMVPGGLFRFTIPKIAFLAAGLGIGLLVRSRSRLATPVAWCAAGVFLVFALRTVVGDGPGPSFWGRWPRYEGVPVVGAYLLLLPVGARLLGPLVEKTQRTKWTLILTGGMLLLALIAVLETAGVHLLGDAGDFRFGGTLGNATDMGIVGLTGCAALLPAAVFRRAPWEIAGVISGAIVAVSSGSRAVIIVLTIVIVSVFVWYMRQGWAARGQRHAGLWLVGALVSVAAAVFAFPSAGGRLLTSETVTGRADLWQASWALVQDNWFFGVGPGHFVDALPRYQTEGFAARVGTDYPADSPHMIPLQWLADGGLPLLLANLLLCVAVLSIGVRNLKASRSEPDKLFLAGAMAAVCSFALVLLTHFPTPGTTVIVGLCAGALSGVGTLTPRAGKTTWLKRAPGPVRKVAASKVRAVASWTAAACLVFMTFAAVAASVAETTLKKGETAIRDGRLAEASHDFETAIVMRPWDSDVALLAGQAFAGRAAAGDPASGKLAARWSSRALEANPGSVEFMTSLAVGQLAASDVVPAAKTLAAARRAAPVNSLVWLQSGLAEYAAGRTDAAIKYVERAISLTPHPEEEKAILAALQETVTAR